MNIILKKTLSQHCKEYKAFAGMKITNSLMSFSDVIDDVSVFLSDSKSEKSTDIKECKIIIYTIHGGTLMVSNANHDIRLAIKSAALLAKMSLKNLLKKIRLNSLVELSRQSAEVALSAPRSAKQKPNFLRRSMRRRSKNIYGVGSQLEA